MAAASVSAANTADAVHHLIATSPDFLTGRAGIVVSRFAFCA